MSSRSLWILLAAGALAGGAVYVARGAAPGIVRPRHPEVLDAGVRAIVEERVAAVESAPRDPERHGLLALAYEANEMYVEALAAYGVAARLAPDDPTWPYHAAVNRWLAGDPAVALAEIDEVLRRFPRHVQARYRRGEWRVERGDLDGAAEDFRVTVELQPDVPQGHVGLGKVALERGDPTAAAEHLLRALTRDAGHGVAHFLLGRAYRGLGRFEEAEREQALGLGAETVFLGDRMDALVREATAGLMVQIEEALDLLDANEVGEAVRLLERARATHPADTRLLNNLAIAYRRAGQHERQLEALEEARRLAPDELATWVNLINCHLALERYDDALATSGRALEIDPRSAQAWFGRGRALLLLRRVDEAYQALGEAVRHGPRLDDARSALAETCLILSKTDEARGHLQELARRRPNDLVTHVNLAETCLMQGDVVGAEAAHAAAARLAPEHPRVVKLAEKIQERRGR